MNRLIIFSGFNQRAVIAILRCLVRNGIDDYLIIACGEDDPIFLTEYSERVYYTRKHRELYNPEIYELFRRIVSENKGFSNVIVPSTEGLNRFMIQFRSEIEDIGMTIPLADSSLYRSISDKRTFWEICRDNDLCVPQIIDIGYKYKCRYVAKPKTYISPSGERYVPYIIDSEEKNERFLNSFDLSFFDIQEFVDGESIYLLYYLAKTGVDYSYSQINLVQQPNGKSMIASLPWDAHKEPISDKYVSLIRKLGYSGFIMIELRKNDKGYCMIEANPRMWGPSQLYVDAGVPFIEAFLYDHGIIGSIPERKITEAAYFWSGGIAEDLMTDRSCVWLERGRELVSANKDLLYGSDIYNRPDTIGYFNREIENWRENG